MHIYIYIHAPLLESNIDVEHPHFFPQCIDHSSKETMGFPHRELAWEVADILACEPAKRKENIRFVLSESVFT